MHTVILSAMSSGQPIVAKTRPVQLRATVAFNRPLCRRHFRLRLNLLDPLPPAQPGQFIQLLCRPPGPSNSSADSSSQPPPAVEPADILGKDWDWPGDTPTAPPRLSQIELRRPLALLPRPFSLAARALRENLPPDSADWIEIIYRTVGTATHWLARLSPGQELQFLGPLGNAFQLPSPPFQALLVAGGVGLPPLLYLAETLSRTALPTVALVGVASADLLPLTLQPHQPPDPDAHPRLCTEEFARLGCPTILASEDGSLGFKGLVTDALEKILNRLSPTERRRIRIFACGPTAMLRRTAHLAQQFNIPCQVSLEQAMACGVGTCQSCAVPVRTAAPSSDPWHYRLACTDGPVFDAATIAWDRL